MGQRWRVESRRGEGRGIDLGLRLERRKRKELWIMLPHSADRNDPFPFSPSLSTAPLHCAVMSGC